MSEHDLVAEARERIGALEQMLAHADEALGEKDRENLRLQAEVKRLRDLILDWWEAMPDDAAATYAAGLGLGAEAKHIRALRGEGEK